MWEGIITSVQDNEFCAIVFDRDSSRLEIGNFPFDCIDQTDRELVKPGAIFTWSIEDKRCQFQREGKLSEDEFQKRLEQVKRDWSSFAG